MNNSISLDEIAEFRAFIAPPTFTAPIDGKEKLLVTCGGAIRCARCQGTSRRTKLQCGAPALKTSRTNKCKFHGGASTGARTVEGRQRISASLLVHGRETNAIRVERQLKTLELRQLEDILVLTGGIKRKAGAKPLGYKQINTISEAYEYISVIENLPTGSLGRHRRLNTALLHEPKPLLPELTPVPKHYYSIEISGLGNKNGRLAGASYLNNLYSYDS